MQKHILKNIHTPKTNTWIPSESPLLKGNSSYKTSFDLLRASFQEFFFESSKIEEQLFRMMITMIPTNHPIESDGPGTNKKKAIQLWICL